MKSIDKAVKARLAAYHMGSAYRCLEDAGCGSDDLEDLQDWINDIHEVADILEADTEGAYGD